MQIQKKILFSPPKSSLYGLTATAPRTAIMFGTRSYLSVTLALVIGYRYLMGPYISSIAVP